MKKYTKSILISVLVFLFLFTCYSCRAYISFEDKLLNEIADRWLLQNEFIEEPIESETLGGRSGPKRDVVGTSGTPTPTTTSPVWFSNNNDLSGVATSTDVTMLLQSTDAVLFTIEQATASTTNFFNWYITGSNEDYCDTLATTTASELYVSTEPLVEDINWYPLIAADVTASGYDNYGYNNSVGTQDNASTTSFLLTDVNWNCLRTQYKGASTTVLMQIKEKILTIQ